MDKEIGVKKPYQSGGFDDRVDRRRGRTDVTGSSVGGGTELSVGAESERLPEGRRGLVYTKPGWN